VASTSKYNLKRQRPRDILSEGKSPQLIIWTLTPDFVITGVSTSTESITGFRQDELVGKKISRNGILAPAYASSFELLGERVMKGEDVTSETYELITKEEKRKRVKFSAIPFRHNGEVVGIVAVGTDVTRITRDQLAMQKELVHADKMISLGVLASGIAHEINNPNNFIMLNTPLLRDAWEDALPMLDDYYRENGDFRMGGLFYSEIRDEIPQLFSGIEEGSRRIQRIVADLRDYARLDTARVIRPVDINDVVQKAVGLVMNMIKKSTSKFNLSLGSGLPLIKGNPQRLEQVVINLIQNACQALTQREQAVRVSTKFNKESKEVLIEVADEGQGIEADILYKIMAPFFTTKRAGEGTGLGLAVSEKIVREHGGQITVSSERGKGSVFQVVLPVDTEKRKIKVLIVDDDEGFRHSMKDVLESSEAYDVDTAPNGVEACINIGKTLPDLLVVDIMMPDMDGVEVCRVIRERKDLSRIKVLVVTGHPSSPKIRTLKEMGFTHILLKPFKFDVFLKKIEEMVEGV